MGNDRNRINEIKTILSEVPVNASSTQIINAKKRIDHASRKNSFGVVESLLVAVVLFFIACLVLASLSTQETKKSTTIIPTATVFQPAQPYVAATAIPYSGNTSGSVGSSPNTGVFLPTQPLPTIVYSYPTQQSAGSRICPSSPAPRLNIGDIGYVIPAYGASNLNKYPRTSGNNNVVVAIIQAGETFDVIGGPECGDGFTWWQARYHRNSFVGWLAEGQGDTYWLDRR
jgi:hypothetical protein